MKIREQSLLLTLCFSIFSLSNLSARVQSPLDSNITKSYRLERQRDYTSAIKEMYKMKDKTYFYHLRLGWLFYLNKQYKNSLHLYGEALKLKPKSVSAHLGLSYAHSALGNNDESMLYLIKGFDTTLFNSRIGKELLKSYLRRGLNVKGLETAQILHEYHPEDSIIIEYLVLFNQSLEKYSVAMKYSKKLLQINPSSVLAFEIMKQGTKGKVNRAISSMKEEP